MLRVNQIFISISFFRYLTPTEEIVEKKEVEVEDVKRIIKTDLENEDRTVEIIESVNSDNQSNVECANSFSENVDDITNSKQTIYNNETVIKIPEAVPIVENSAVSVELEPSKNDSSLGENTVVQSSDNDSRLDKEGAVESETEVPPFENIPTISQFCDPSHYDNTTNNTVTEVVIDSVNVNHQETATSVHTQKATEEIKRRVSLPSSSTVESQTGDHFRDAAAQAVSPQKRPRSASTSTQVDSNLFGMFVINITAIHITDLKNKEI